jgi:transaldolase
MMNDLKIDLYADGSDIEEIKRLNANPLIKGFTTNPSLMRKSGITNYIEFVNDVMNIVKYSPVSFEVFSDDIDEMEIQAKKIAKYGDNIYIKIPITNTKGVSTANLVKSLISEGIKVNITAIFTIEQLITLLPFISSSTPVILSIFAGRIADTGIDPKSIVKWAINNKTPNAKILWASPREIYNLYEAESVGCDIITMTPSLIDKINIKNKCLTEYSLETVKMFYDDALKAGYTL